MNTESLTVGAGGALSRKADGSENDSFPALCWRVDMLDTSFFAFHRTRLSPFA